MIQREREREGDEFADKEAFVTQAYKDQQAEVRRAEEEEKKREGLFHTISQRMSSSNTRNRGGEEEKARGIRNGILLQQDAGRE